MEKIIYTKPLRMPDDSPSRITDSIRVTKEDDLITKVEKFTGEYWEDVPCEGQGGDDNTAAIRLLLNGEKINLGEITGTSLEDILPEAFENYLSNKLCTWTLTIPEGTTEIEENAFCEGPGGSGSGGVGLLCTSLNLPDELTSIGAGAFLNLIEITDLVIPDSVETVGGGAFAGCALLENVTYPMGATYGDNVFKGAAISDMLYSNTSVLFVPDDISGDIIIPEGVTTVPSEIFRQKSGITSVTFPSTLTSLGERMFKGCINLKTIIFEDSELETLGQQWFCGSSGSEAGDTRTSIVLKFDHVIPLSNIQGWNSNVLNYYVPDSLVDDYKAATNWSGMTSKILPLSSVYTTNTEFYGVGESLSATTLLTSITGQVTIDSATTESLVISNVAYEDNRLTFNIAQCEQQDVTFSITYHIENSAEYTTSITINVAVVATELQLADILGAAYATTDGSLYFDVESLNASGKTLQGILITDGTHRYVMSKDYIPSVAYDGGGKVYEYWGAYGTEVQNIVTTTSSNEALQDFKGKLNTDQIVSQITSGDGYFNVEPYSAAGLCAQYQFPNKAKAYMWAAGEENIAVKNKNLVKKLVEDVEGTATNAFNNYIWSSTQYSSGNAWNYLFNLSLWSNYTKSNYSCVVPVCAFPFIPSSILLNGENFNTYYKDSSATLTIESNFNNMTVQSVTSSNENVTVGELSEEQVTITFADAEYSSVDLTVTLLNTDTNEIVTDVHTVNIISEDEYTIFHVNHVGLVTKTGALYKDVADWTSAGSEELQGILVTEGNHQFVASPDAATFDFGDGETANIYWGGYEIEIPGIKTTENLTEALTDFDGQGNTAKIVSYLNEDTHDSYFQIAPYSAAGVCANFEFPNGQKGYMWSAGEENLAVKYKSAISTILTDLEKDTNWASQYYIWNSTQGSSYYAWTYYFNNSNWGNGNKNGNLYVVPVCAFPLSTSSL